MRQVRSAVGLGFDHDRDPVAVDLDRVRADVVGPRVEGAAGTQVEAGVVPVARDEPALDGAAVQREPHVRAAVVEGVRVAVAPEHADRLGAGLPGEAAARLQLLERPDRDAIRHAFPIIPLQGNPGA